MKKLQRTRMTWRFMNSMAPAHPNYMPTKVCDANLVEVTATMFRGRANLTIWFETEKMTEVVQSFFIRDQFRSVFENTLQHQLGTELDYGDNRYPWTSAVFMNGNCIQVDLKFNLKNGESFTHAAMQKFVKLVTLIGQEKWRERYFLPMPEVVQETMVEAFAKNNWVTYGEYLYNKFQPQDPIGPKSDFEKEIEKDRDTWRKVFQS